MNTSISKAVAEAMPVFIQDICAAVSMSAFLAVAAFWLGVLV